MRKIGINMGATRGLSNEEYVKTIKELGFEAVFTGVPSKEGANALGELYAKYGISWDTMHSPFHHINDMWLDNEDGAKMHQDLLNAVDMCAYASVPITVIHLSSGFTPPDLTPLGHQRYDAIVEHAAKKGVKVHAPAKEPEVKKAPKLAKAPEVKKKPADRKSKLMLAAADYRNKDYAAAKLTLKELLKERADDVAALNLKAAVELAEGNVKAAEETLHSSIRSNPRSHYAYYNLARLILETRGPTGKADARRYYENGREYCSGPVDKTLEEALK